MVIEAVEVTAKHVPGDLGAGTSGTDGAAVDLSAGY
jgi:hypothetical protein